ENGYEDHTPGVGPGRSQYYNEMKKPSDNPEDQAIVWDAFPKTLTRIYGRSTALRLADTLDSKSSFLDGFVARQQDEYCEWKVEKTGSNITRIIFTCEGPEYWASMAGGVSLYASFDFGLGDQAVLLELYKTLLARNDIPLDDLFATVGGRRYY